MTTLHTIMTSHGVEIPAHLEVQAEIPILQGLQRQGDVVVVPMKSGRVSGLANMPSQGIAVVRGEAGGNTHLLVGGGKWAPNHSDPATMGTLVVEREPAYLIHPEHGATGIGIGHYMIRRQREQADVERLVAD